MTLLEFPVGEVDRFRKRQFAEPCCNDISFSGALLYVPRHNLQGRVAAGAGSMRQPVKGSADPARAGAVMESRRRPGAGGVGRPL